MGRFTQVFHDVPGERRKDLVIMSARTRSMSAAATMASFSLKAGERLLR